MSKKRSFEHKKAQNEVKNLESFQCAVCGYIGQSKDGYMEGHHLIPMSEGGDASLHNMITLCQKCHRDYHRGNLDIDIRRF